MTGNLALRLRSLEAATTGLKQTMTVVWGGVADDPALAAAEAEAERMGKLLIVIRKFSNPHHPKQEAHQ